MIRFEDIGLRYGTGPEVLRGINFTLTPGSFHFLTGASGAGKSSLMRLMYVGLRPTRGCITLFDRDVATLKRDDLPALRRQIGVVFQNFRLLDHLSALDNVALPLRMAGIAESEIREHVAELLGWVGLGDHLDARPPTLSGGQQQRIAIARSVIARPRLLLADEPTGNVDDSIGMRLLYLFEELYKLGTTVVIATHNEGLISRFGHPRLHLDQGTLAVVPAGTRMAVGPITPPALPAALAGPIPPPVLPAALAGIVGPVLRSPPGSNPNGES
ncbi:MAG: ATP-binding cassette domain-containing protein [Rhodospirillaceae bacterium]